MDKFEAILVITLLTWAAVSVFGTSPELSTTTGDTVNIPCVFGEGTLRNIFWYYNDGTGPQKILFLSKGVLAIDPEYADRASLQNDNLTLILKDIVVPDEGTYRCDVDRQGQTPVPNINTKLNVFSLRPDTLPVITPNCTWADGFSSCSIHAKQSFTLTCTLPNVYPVEDTKLIWYQDGKHIPSTPDVTQNDDGTTNISEQIQVYVTGNFTCNATYLSVNGTENTAASVIPPADVPKKMTSGQIAGMTIGIVLCVGIIIFVIVSLKARGNCSFSNDTKSDATSGKSESQPCIEPSTKNGSEVVKGDGDNRSQNSNDDSQQDQAGAESINIPVQQRIHLSPKKEDGDPSKPQNKKDDSELVQVTETSELIGSSAEEGPKDEKVDGDNQTSQKFNDDSQQDPVTEDSKLLGISAEEVSKDEKVDGDDRTSHKINDNSQQIQVTETSELLGSSAGKGPKDEKGRTSPTEESDFDTLLIALAKKIPGDTMNDLGKKLGFDAVEINRYEATNLRYEKVTCSGILTMLRDWDKTQTKAEERTALKKALHDAGLVRLADEF